MNVRIYVEGGGNTKALKTKCREGFKEFFRKAGLEDRVLKVVACGGNRQAYDDFCIALKKVDKKDFIVLLVDSEVPVGSGSGVWTHLEWDKPPAATDDNAHLMVQCMESWFLADKDMLEAFFGKEFKRNALPARPEIENIEKKDVLDGLENATRHCGKKGRYDKGRHSFEILAKIDPDKVKQASPHAKRLVEILIDKANH